MGALRQERLGALDPTNDFRLVHPVQDGRQHDDKALQSASAGTVEMSGVLTAILPSNNKVLRSVALCPTLNRVSREPESW
jgi:hypothetical protein